MPAAFTVFVFGSTPDARMEKSGKTRRVAVFQSDGTIIYDQVDENVTGSRPDDSTGGASDAAGGSSSVSMSRPLRKSKAGGAATHTIPADKLWKLIKVFAQFSRDVQGGNVRRLIFRNPKSYAPPDNCFHPAPPSSSALPHRSAPVTIIHIAFGERFVVAVSERLTGDAASTSILLNAPPPVFTVAEFCNNILEFLQQKQENHILLATPRANRQKGGELFSQSTASASNSMDKDGNTNITRHLRTPSISTNNEQNRNIESTNGTQRHCAQQTRINIAPIASAPQTDNNLRSQLSSDSRVTIPLSDQIRLNQQPPPLPPVTSQVDYTSLAAFIKNSQNLLGA